MEPQSSNAALPIACKLASAELQARHGEIEALFASVAQVRELPDGYTFAFAADTATARALLDFIMEERECCPFFTFALTFATPHDAIGLTLQGGAGVKDFVRDSFGTLANASRPD